MKHLSMVRREFPAGHTGAMEHLGTFLTLCCESWDGCGGEGVELPGYKPKGCEQGKSRRCRSASAAQHTSVRTAFQKSR